MISGTVSANLEPAIGLVVIGPSGRRRDLSAIVDTGFTGFLTLPPEYVASLGLPWLCRESGMLADGSQRFFDVYVAVVVWDGQPRTVPVEAGGPEPLVGMSLMERFSLRVDVADGGKVSITPFP
jgi:clan AA aspartic protease